MWEEFFSPYTKESYSIIKLIKGINQDLINYCKSENVDINNLYKIRQSNKNKKQFSK